MMAVMKDKTWERHANPLSVFTRIISYPLVFIPLWFISDFINDPYSNWNIGVIGIIVIIWFTINPRIFKKPKNFDSYLSRGVLGEKLWTENRKIDNFSTALTIIIAPFFLISLYTTYMQLFWETMFFASFPFVLKLWFIYRMVFLYNLNK